MNHRHNPASDYLAELAETGYGELEDYYPRTAAGTMEVFSDADLYYGRNVIWDGTEGRMVRVSAEHMEPIEGNIFDADKLHAIVSGIENAEDRLVFTAPYGEAHVITLTDIRESIKYGDAEPLTLDDEELDQWLVDPDDFLDEQGYDSADLKEYLNNPQAYLEFYSDDPEEQAEMVEIFNQAVVLRQEMQDQLVQAVAEGWGDLGQFRFQIRDGNHRGFGALAAGEPYIWMIISNNQMQDVNDPSVQRPDIVALREILQ
jgi:hypothetical protein